MKKKHLLIFIPVLIIILSYWIIRNQSAKQLNIEIQEEDAVYINTIDELNKLEGFKEIRLKVTKGSITDSSGDGGIFMDHLEMENKGVSRFNFTSQKWETSDDLTMSMFTCTTDSELNCTFFLNSDGLPSKLCVTQEKPSGFISIDYKGDNRWENFRYFPMQNRGDGSKKKYRDFHIDIDFDGYFDVRFIADNTLKKVNRQYIMLGMDWEKMEAVDVDRDVPVAVNQEGAEYVFRGGSWIESK